MFAGGFNTRLNGEDNYTATRRGEDTSRMEAKLESQMEAQSTTYLTARGSRVLYFRVLFLILYSPVRTPRPHTPTCGPRPRTARAQIHPLHPNLRVVCATLRGYQCHFKHPISLYLPQCVYNTSDRNKPHTPAATLSSETSQQQPKGGWLRPLRGEGFFMHP